MFEEFLYYNIFEYMLVCWNHRTAFFHICADLMLVWPNFNFICDPTEPLSVSRAELLAGKFNIYYIIFYIRSNTLLWVEFSGYRVISFITYSFRLFNKVRS